MPNQELMKKKLIKHGIWATVIEIRCSIKMSSWDLFIWKTDHQEMKEERKSGTGECLLVNKALLLKWQWPRVISCKQLWLSMVINHLQKSLELSMIWIKMVMECLHKESGRMLWAKKKIKEMVMRLDKTKDHQVSTGLNLDQLLQRQKWTCKISKEATDLPIQMLLWKKFKEPTIWVIWIIMEVSTIENSKTFSILVEAHHRVTITELFSNGTGNISPMIQRVEWPWINSEEVPCLVTHSKENKLQRLRSCQISKWLILIKM